MTQQIWKTSWQFENLYHMIQQLYFEIFTQLILKFMFKQMSAPNIYIFFHNEQKLEASKKFFNKRIAKQTSTFVQCIFIVQWVIILIGQSFIIGQQLMRCKKIWMILKCPLLSNISQSGKDGSYSLQRENYRPPESSDPQALARWFKKEKQEDFLKNNSLWHNLRHNTMWWFWGNVEGPGWRLPFWLPRWLRL